MSAVELLERGDEYAGKEVSFDGLLIGACLHGGRKGFIKDSDGEMDGFLRVDIGGKAKPFTQDNVGEIIRVSGTLVEKRIDAAYLDRWEAKAIEQAKQHKKEEECKHACPEGEEEAKVLERIKEYRAALAASSKGYLSSFSFAADGWTIVTEQVE